jgi:hypothetical protein
LQHLKKRLICQHQLFLRAQVHRDIRTNKYQEGIVCGTATVGRLLMVFGAFAAA